MSRLCRLKSYKTIGSDGKWAYKEIISLRKQRDELLAALEGMVEVARLTIGWSCTPANANGQLVVAERLIARVKGGAV